MSLKKGKRNLTLSKTLHFRVFVFIRSGLNNVYFNRINFSLKKLSPNFNLTVIEETYIDHSDSPHKDRS